MGVALLLGGLLLAACGGTPASSSSTSTTTSASSTHSTAGNSAQASAAFTNCLKSHGVTLPSGGFGNFAQRSGDTTSPTRPTSGTVPSGGSASGFNARGHSTQSAKAQAAFKACAKYRPKGFGAPGGFGGGFSNSAATAAFRNCMSLHGVKLSQPSTTNTRPSTTSGSSTQRPPDPRNNPKYASAFKACKALLPTTSTTTTTAG